LVNIRIDLPPGVSQHDLQLPVWNATYQVRDFAQYVNHVRAHDAGGHALPLRQIDQATWRIWGAEHGATVEYDETLDLPGPYSAQFNEHHASLNLALVLMYPTDARSTPVSLGISGLLQGWQIATAMSQS